MLFNLTASLPIWEWGCQVEIRRFSCNSSPQLKFVASAAICRLSWNSSPQLKFVASVEIRRFSCNSSPQLKFVSSVEIRRFSWNSSLQLQLVSSVEIRLLSCASAAIRRLKTNAAWRDRRHETAHRLVKCTSTELLVLTQTAPHKIHSALQHWLFPIYVSQPVLDAA